MKVLFLTRYPYEGASSRYRVFQYIPHLEVIGISCHTQSFMSSRLYKLNFTRGRKAYKTLLTFWAFIRRFWTLLFFWRYDVIYMQRELFPFGPPVLEKIMKKCGAVLIMDYDDALFIHKDSLHNRLINLIRAPERIYDIFALSDCVLAGNDYLTEVAGKYCKDARTFEVAEDTVRIQKRPLSSNDDGVRIGWLGSATTAKYLKLIAGPLKQITQKFKDVTIEVVGAGDFSIEGLHITNTPWSLDGELSALARFDIGIMPLPNEVWSKGKSGGKARTYMAAGIAAVCQNIGYNQVLIEDGKTGFLVSSQEEWVDTLSKLIENPDLRNRVGEAARADVERRFSVHDKAAEMAEILRECYARRTATKVKS